MPRDKLDGNVLRLSLNKNNEIDILRVLRALREKMMKVSPYIFTLVLSWLTMGIAHADHHGSHQHGPRGGVLVELEGGDQHVELVVTGGDVVTARLLDRSQKPVKNTLEFLTLTFTEPDGEKEDYKIEGTKQGEESVFQRISGHVVHHIVRDPIVISITRDGKTYSSKEFSFPHGPYGGELITLGKESFIAEICVDSDSIAVHILNKQKRPVKVKAKEFTFTFTEKDGEVEDYQIPIHNDEGKGTIFQMVDDHIVKHMKRDPIIATLVEDGVTHDSASFRYPQ